MKHLIDYVSVFKNVIPEDICKSTISILEADPNWGPHEWTGAYDPNLDRSKDLDILYSDHMKQFNPVIGKCLMEYIKPHGKIVEMWTKIRVNKYTTGKQMAEHVDLIRKSATDGIPVLSILGMLNDNFKGGDFIMFGDTKIDLKQGDILMFPSTFFYPHLVTEVTEGTRYSFVTWAY
jgi:hypothetical protein